MTPTGIAASLGSQFQELRDLRDLRDLREEECLGLLRSKRLDSVAYDASYVESTDLLGAAARPRSWRDCEEASSMP